MQLNIKGKKLNKTYRFKCQYCGTTRWYNYWKTLIKLIFTEKHYFYCPECHKVNCYRFMPHIVHDTDQVEKEYNKKINFDKRLL